MNKLITQDNSGNIWVENNEGAVFGIVSSLEILDEDGLQFDADTFSILESNGFELEQDWCDGVTTLVLSNATVLFTSDEVKLGE